MPDLTEYDKAPISEEVCEWCGESGDEEQGPVRWFNGGDEIMHSGCMYSYEHGALRTARDDAIRPILDEAAAEEQAAYDDKWPSLDPPWWANR